MHIIGTKLYMIPIYIYRIILAKVKISILSNFFFRKTGKILKRIKIFGHLIIEFWLVSESHRQLLLVAPNLWLCAMLG